TLASSYQRIRATQRCDRRRSRDVRRPVPISAAERHWRESNSNSIGWICPCPPRFLGGTGLGVVFGGVLLFHPGWVVSSALAGLASGFGMGPGVSLSLWPP